MSVFGAESFRSERRSNRVCPAHAPVPTLKLPGINSRFSGTNVFYTPAPQKLVSGGGQLPFVPKPARLKAPRHFCTGDHSSPGLIVTTQKTRIYRSFLSFGLPNHCFSPLAPTWNTFEQEPDHFPRSVLELATLQGYLAHEKKHSPLGPP